MDGYCSPLWCRKPYQDECVWRYRYASLPLGALPFGNQRCCFGPRDLVGAVVDPRPRLAHEVRVELVDPKVVDCLVSGRPLQRQDLQQAAMCARNKVIRNE